MSAIQPDDRGLIVSCANCGQNNRLAYERLSQLPRCAKCGTKLSPPGEPIDMEHDVIFEALVARAALPVLVSPASVGAASPGAGAAAASARRNGTSSMAAIPKYTV